MYILGDTGPLVPKAASFHWGTQASEPSGQNRQDSCHHLPRLGFAGCHEEDGSGAGDGDNGGISVWSPKCMS